LLCDLLTASGVAGRPNSFFRRESFSEWADYLNVPTAKWPSEHEFDQSYLTAIQQEGSGGTQVFGMRLMWESVCDLSERLGTFYPNLLSDDARLKSTFGSPVYLHLSREDKVAQAVSRLKAEQSGLWHVNADGTERERMKPAQVPVYDFQKLSTHLAELEEHDAAWMNWFAQQEIQPVVITYASLSTEPQITLANVLSALGQDPSIAEIINPGTTKLADGGSRDWVNRYRAERHN
jgi:LPS sulfotransferase NodH